MGRKIPGWQVAIVMIFTIISFMYAMDMLTLITGVEALASGYGELHIPLILSAIFAGLVAVLNGYKWTYLEAGIMASINRSMQAMLILMVVGMLIGSWIAAGIVPAMIYYGLSILSPGIFLFAGCILCSIVALATGSSWTTAGTIGIALIGIGSGLGIDPAMTAGAIVSGAYFGDKMSPLSDTTNLAPAVAGSNLFDHIRHMLWTVTPSLLIALIIYFVLGMGAEEASLTAVTQMQTELGDLFNINLALLIPPLLVIIIVALKLPALPGLIAGVLLGCIFGSIFQGIHFSDWFSIVHYGFAFAEDASVSDQLIELLNRGGMDSMLWTVNLIICAMVFGGIMDASGMLGSLATGLLKLARNTGSLVTVTAISCVAVNVLAADQYLSIILPGRMYKEAYEDRRLAPENLSRALEDTGTITSNLIPWNTCGVTMASFLGVGQWGAGGYAPYAFLCWINPLVSIFYGFTGISMKKMSEEEYQAILVQRAAEKAAEKADLEG